MSEANIALLTGIWSRLLQTSPIAPDDNFFDLGGDSLLAVNMFLEIERVTGRHFEITTIYDAPTIAELAKLLETEHTTAFSPFVKLKDGDSTPFFIVHGVGGTVIELAALGKQITSNNPVYAIQAKGIDGSLPPLERVEHMAEFYAGEIRKMQPHGPYLIGGYSFGGVVALEVARRLGPENIAKLMMLDSFAHPHTWPLKSRVTVRARKLAVQMKHRLKQPPRETLAFLATKMRKLVTRRTAEENAAERAEHVNNWLGAVSPDLPLPLRQTRIGGDAALLAFRPSYYPGKITFLRAGMTGPVFPSDARNIWRKLVKEMESHTLKGDHRSIIGDDVATTAAKMSDCLAPKTQKNAELTQQNVQPLRSSALPAGI
jgi:thioesterase domain-containing protein/acyl carrier protein